MSQRAILFADLAGFSRHMRENEPATVAYIAARLTEARDAVEAVGGEVVKTTGDGFVAHFATVPAALTFAIGFQRAEPDTPGIRHGFRIGVHFGPVHFGNADIYGHAVNIAARLEGIAPPGGITISGAAFRRAETFARDFSGRGPVVLRNIGENITAYDYSPGRNEPASLPADVTVIGSLHISSEDGARVELRSERARILLGILVLGGPDPQQRTQCAALMGDPEDAAGLEAARRTLARAFRRAGAAGLRLHDEGTIGVDQSVVRVDLYELPQDTRSGAVDPKLVRGIDWDVELAPGLGDQGGSLAGWARVMRGRWRREAAGALEVCLKRFRAEEDGARVAAEALLLIEPGHEPAARVLIRHYNALGNRAMAMQEYERLRDWLTGRYDMAPSAETEALIAEIRAGDAADAVPPGSLADTRRPDLRVGAFSASDSNTDLAAGLRSDVVAALSRFREWYVAESSGRDGGDYLLTARVDEQHATFSFTRTSDGAVLWQERLASGADWKRSQEQLVARVAARAEVYVSADRVARAFGGTSSSQFDDWMRAEGLLARWDADAETEAATLLENLLERDPAFAPAYASLASIYNVRHIVRPGLSRSDEDTRRALATAVRATELDPLDARGQLAFAWASAMAGHYDLGTVHLDLATTLNPTSSRTVISAAMGFAFFGRAERARDLFEKTARTAPVLARWQWCYGVPVRFFAGDFSGAADAALQGGDAIKDNYGWLAASYAALEDRESAAAAFDTLLETIKPLWEGSVPLDAVSLARWFISAYPLRRPEDTARLTSAIALAAGLEVSALTGSA
ncbi:adenylate/guanylate cyclase domain-containing protein [Roseobacter ponti]|nr:adenylate/guanylate cyclase domain-containing protein [Roseobacter ponti]